MPARTRLEIRCTGRRVSKVSNKPVGRTCGTVFTSSARYRSRANWIERARAAGWRISPLRPDNTVLAYCPNCVTGKKRKKKSSPDQED
jgi:hypothetical protein